MVRLGKIKCLYQENCVEKQLYFGIIPAEEKKINNISMESAHRR